MKMKRYEIVARTTLREYDCKDCLFTGGSDYDGCRAPRELNCDKNIWILEEIHEDTK